MILIMYYIGSSAIAVMFIGREFLHGYVYMDGHDLALDVAL